MKPPESKEDRFDVYLFDLDGTLLDSIELIFRCYRHAASVHLSVSPPDEVWRDGLGTPLREQFRAVSEDTELIERMVVTYREYHQIHHDASVKLYPRVEEVLSGLAGRGKRLGVVTSKLRRGAERGLALMGLDGRFEVLVTADEVARPKPHPEPVTTALTRLGARPDRAVFIGDSPHDVAAGNGAGVATAAVLWGPFEESDLAAASPTYWLRSPEEILAL